MKKIVAISGPVASGKSIIAHQAQKRFDAYRISTRQLLLDAGAQDERSRLIEEGKRLDAETDGRWVLERSRRYVAQHGGRDVIVNDLINIGAQRISSYAKW